MGYRTLADCIEDLRRHGQLVEIQQEVDPFLEIAAIQRRVYENQGPALFFRQVKGTRFPVAANLFGTLERARFLFRDTLETVRALVALKVNPASALRRPGRLLGLGLAGGRLIPRRARRGPVLEHRIRVEELPQIVCWPRDGGAFVTLPQVYSEDPDRPGLAHSNLGMYRVQLSGNQYVADEEVGLHYQLHRGIGVHHAAAVRRGERLPVNVIVGGPPAWAVAAVMPLPEGLPEIAFAGLLGGRAARFVRPRPGGLPIPIDADFCLAGSIDPHQVKPEGPFGDHLGYYSLTHDFPVMRVDAVYHRPGAIWPFTSVGRPPQEDTTFGELIHELTGPIIPSVLPGVKGVHAVDAAGVHPLLLARGSERYLPYEQSRKPRELLTQANAILGQGQLSLAKYLFIVAEQDDPALDLHDLAAFFRHVLERVDWERDLHFQTRTTIDTLDYSGDALNEGSKVVIASAGPKKRALESEIPGGLSWPEGFGDPRVVGPGILAVRAPRHGGGNTDVRRLCEADHLADALVGFPLIVLVDDAEFTARSFRNFVWVTFTRSNPAADIEGFRSFSEQKHWGCRGPLVIDARIKPRHAPPLEDDPEIERRVDALGAPGGPLHGVL